MKIVNSQKKGVLFSTALSIFIIIICSAINAQHNTDARQMNILLNEINSQTKWIAETEQELVDKPRIAICEEGYLKYWGAPPSAHYQ